MKIEFVGKHGGVIIHAVEPETGPYNFEKLSTAIWDARAVYNIGHKVNWLVMENCIRAIGRATEDLTFTPEQGLQLINETIAAFTGRGNW